MSRGFASAAAVAEVLNQCYGKRRRIAKVKDKLPRAQSRHGRTSGGKIATCATF
jgi:hypothetical protein